MKKYLLISIFIFSALSSFFTGKVLADTAAIPDPKVPCTEDDYNNPEFNSLRPYQASPCRSAPYASMCGNNIKVTIAHVSCPYAGGDTCACTGPECSATKRVVIDLSNVKLPILGNTQDVVNSKNSTDIIDDAQKLNQYVSWYLAGASQKAEYGVDSTYKTVNFSGPANKLLPQAEQEFFRFESLHESGTKTEVTLDSTDDTTGITDINSNQAGVQTNETGNHNQIVLCTTKNAFGISNPWIGVETPTPCYSGNGAKASGKIYRLNDWWNSKAVGLIESTSLLPGWDGSQRWGYHVPPFPWQFAKDILYQKAYNEWRGRECVILFGKLLCVDLRIPGVIDIHSNSWADFYQYIPLSNTVDKKGKETYGGATVSAPHAEILSSSTDIAKVPNLFYPHTEEVSGAIVNLNKTFVPKTGVDTKAIPVNTEDNTSTCQLLNVKTGAGDDLTFSNTKGKQQIDFNVTYSVGNIDCRQTGSRTIDPCALDTTGFCTATPYEKPVFKCDSDITASLTLTTLAPHLTDIWQNTTAGAGSTFRMIFPKVEAGAPVSCISDMPAASSANYDLNGLSSGSVTDLSVKNPPTATEISPQIYFPHLGGVYEYFLKGIQTALRPQGYGDPIANGTQCTTATTGIGSCKQWLFEKDKGGQYYYDKIISAANSTSCNGKSLNPYWAIGIALNEDGGLLSDTLDGSAKAHFGCNIGQVQTIEDKISCMTNTLRNDCLAGKTDAQTLSEYGYAPGYVLYPITVLDVGGSYPPPLFGSGFDVSKLKANLLSTDWWAVYKNTAPTFCPNTIIPGGKK